MNDGPDKLICPNCGDDKLGTYCAECGQIQIPARKRWLEYLEEFTDTAFGLKSSALRSVWLMLKAPGELSKLKLENRGGDYVIPVKLFFVVLILYGLFFTLSPVRDGQIVVGLNTEFGYEEEGDSWTVEFFLYQETIEDAFTPAFREAFADGRIEANDVQMAFFERALSDPLVAEDWRRRYYAVAPYLPLLVVVPYLAFGLVIFRRKRYVADHLFVGLEATTLFLLLTTFTGLAAYLAMLLNAPMSEEVVSLGIALPIYLFWLYRADRNFYGMGRLAAIGKVVGVVLAYALLEIAADSWLFRTTMAMAA
ncbi:MAG: hypothetical protein ACXIVL_04715 [Oceanicaulis sp.]